MPISQSELRKIIEESLPPHIIDWLRNREEAAARQGEQDRRLPLYITPPRPEEEPEEETPKRDERGVEIIDYTLESAGKGKKLPISELRQIIRNAILQETMLKIMHNSYEDLDQFNRIANYAINDDIQGALNDPELPTKDLFWILDDMHGWVDKVGDNSERWFSDDVVVPPNWDIAAVNKFMDKLETAADAKVGQDEAAADKTAPNKPERDALASAFTMSVILPDDIKHITYQIRRKGGVPNWIMLEDQDGSLGHMSTGIGKDELSQYGTTIDKLIKVLEDNGARLRKKQKRSPPMMPYYD